MASIRIPVSLGALLGVLCFAASASAGPAGTTHNTFFTGPELSDRLMTNVVTILTADKHKGAGFAIGGDRETTDIATALHTLVSTHDAETANPKDFLSFAVTYCADGTQANVAPSAIIKWDQQADLAIFRVKSPNRVLIEASLDTEPVQTSDPVWSLGRQGECKVGGASGTIDAPVDDMHNFTADMPGATGGTSGSPVMSARGIIGMAWSSTADAKLRAIAISRIEEIAKTLPGVRWALVASGNIPLTDSKTAAMELTQALNNYIFRLKDVRDAWLKETYQVVQLYDINNQYNNAINVVKTIKDKHDSTLEVQWGGKVRADYDSIRISIDSIHAEILALNKLLPKNRKADGVTPVRIRQAMSALSPRVDALDSSITSFVTEIRSGANNAAQTIGK